MEFLLLLSWPDFPPCEQKQALEAIKPLIRVLEEHCQKLTAKNPRLIRLYDYLQKHYAEKVTAEDVRNYMCTSQKTLSRFIKKETGRSLIPLLHQVCIRHAIELLKTTNDTITGIGYSVGFGSAKEFNKIFKRKTGMTPLMFRKGFTI